MTVDGSLCRYHAVGVSDAIRADLAAAVSAEVTVDFPSSPGEHDVLFLALSATDVPLSNSFGACLDLKRRRTGTKVFLVARFGDEVSASIARFCLADGVVEIDPDGIVDLDSLLGRIHLEHRDVPVDAILAKLEDRLQAESDANPDESSTVQRIAEGHVDDSFLGRLTDPETGLFDGPFAAFKLDEEFKRAVRFHQPLSLILLDAGAELPEDTLDRRTVLAEMASIFLNECRDIDTLARFTENVFLFLLPGTGLDGASTVANRMLEGLRERDFAVPVQVAPCAGITTVPHSDVHDRADFLARCEGGLLRARDDASLNGLYAG